MCSYNRVFHLSVGIALIILAIMLLSVFVGMTVIILLSNNLITLSVPKIDEYGKTNRKCDLDGDTIYLNVSRFDCYKSFHIDNKYIQCSDFCDIFNNRSYNIEDIEDIKNINLWCSIESCKYWRPGGPANNSEHCLKLNVFDIVKGNKQIYFTDCYNNYDSDDIYAYRNTLSVLLRSLYALMYILIGSIFMIGGIHCIKKTSKCNKPRNPYLI